MAKRHGGKTVGREVTALREAVRRATRDPSPGNRRAMFQELCRATLYVALERPPTLAPAAAAPAGAEAAEVELTVVTAEFTDGSLALAAFTGPDAVARRLPEYPFVRCDSRTVFEQVLAGGFGGMVLDPGEGAVDIPVSWCRALLAGDVEAPSARVWYADQPFEAVAEAVDHLAESTAMGGSVSFVEPVSRACVQVGGSWLESLLLDVPVAAIGPHALDRARVHFAALEARFVPWSDEEESLPGDRIESLMQGSVQRDFGRDSGAVIAAVLRTFAAVWGLEGPFRLRIEQR